MNKIFGTYVLIMLLILAAATAAQSAPTAKAAEDDLKIVMVSPPPGEAAVQDRVLRVALIAIHAQPSQLVARLENELYVAVKSLATGRVIAAYPGTRSLVVVEPERCAAMLVGAAPMPGQGEIDPPAIPIRPGRYEIIVQRGETVVTNWVVTVISPK